MTVWRQLIAVLHAIAEALKRWRRRSEQADHEKESRSVENDPPGWFDRHFNGADRVRDDVRDDDAGQTGHAEVKKPDGK